VPELSLDDLVRLEEDGGRYGEAKGLGGLEVNDQLELHRLLHAGQAVLAGIVDADALTDLGKLLRPGTGTLGQPVPPIVDRPSAVW